jgi:hypothetical protein
VGRLAVGIGLLLVFFPARILAHTPSQTYFALFLSGRNLSGHWDVALADLHQGMGLRAEDLGRMPSVERQQLEEAMVLDIFASMQVLADGQPLHLTTTDYTTLPLDGVAYARLLFDATEIYLMPRSIEIDVSAAFRIDTNMHGLLRLVHGGRTEVVAFNHQQPIHRFELFQGAGQWTHWVSFVWEGVWHIWIGFDHMLFLLALLLPAVLRFEGNQWKGVERFRDALLNVLKVVTAFTLAHSITLSLAVLDIVRLPTRVVEPAIAASVGVAAAHNLLPHLKTRTWQIAFGFGLIHGFGFASVLIGSQLSGSTLALALFGFNVGVEIGQAMIVVAFVPVAFELRRSKLYTTTTLKPGSAIILLVSMLWMLERLFA